MEAQITSFWSTNKRSSNQRKARSKFAFMPLDSIQSIIRFEKEILVEPFRGFLEPIFLVGFSNHRSHIWSGVIEKVGPGVHFFEPGNEVFGMALGAGAGASISFFCLISKENGTYAEYITISQDLIAKK